MFSVSDVWGHLLTFESGFRIRKDILMTVDRFSGEAHH